MRPLTLISEIVTSSSDLFASPRGHAWRIIVSDQRASTAKCPKSSAEHGPPANCPATRVTVGFGILRGMLDWTTVLTSLAGSGLVSVGVVAGLTRYLGDRWMARYKTSLDQELEAYKDTLERKRKRIETELGHRTYISQVQFETEYQALKDCFAALGKLRLSFNGLRPTLDWVPEDEQEKAKLMVRRLNDFKDRFNPLVDTAASVYPFVPEDIYEQFDICMKAAMLEVRDIEEDIRKALTHSGYVEGHKHREKFDAAYFKAAMLARQRYQQLSIVPD